MTVRLALATAAALSASVAAHAVPLIGVTGNATLIGFDSATPGTVTQTLAVTGLGTELIRGIDFRPSTGQLYAIGQTNFNNPVNLYTINVATGAATRVGTINSSAAIDFDIAFNPVPDRLRVVSADDTNLRVDPSNGATTVDGTLAYAAGDRNAGVNPTVTGVAYTNQKPGPQTTTTLYGIDAATNSLVVVNPPNNGTLTTVGSLGVSLFDFGVGPGIGFDIDGSTGLAFASLTLATGGNNLYGINLSTGSATLIGDFGSNVVRDIAVGSIGAAAAVPEPASLAVFGIGLLGLAMHRRARAG